MTPEQFAYWLQGFAEMNAAPPTAEQWASIKEHLGTVFDKVTTLSIPIVERRGGVGETYPHGGRRLC